ncbi:MAG: ABC transporter ATP-binding protein [Planctomycetes bacterium]|nr:ABC transporter ATP-binding protein [Planctomycetota bacterium]
MPLLEVSNLIVRYGAIEALHGVSLSVEQGQIATLIGCNGAGKSTTLRAVSGLLKPAKGSIRFDGKEITGVAPHEIVRLGVAHSPEGRGVFPQMTVDENLDLGAFARPRSEKDQIRKDREKSLDLFPRLRERLKQLAGTLSGGEQQMLAMARALLARPRLLLLDEPSLGLAPQVVQTIFQIIRDINAAGTTILLVEQNAHMALKVAHHGYVLETGRIAMSDSARVLEASDEVRKAYLGIG